MHRSLSPHGHLNGVQYNPFLPEPQEDDFEDMPSFDDWVRDTATKAGCPPSATLSAEGHVHQFVMRGIPGVKFGPHEVLFYGGSHVGKAKYFIWLGTEATSDVLLFARLLFEALTWHPYVFTPEYATQYATEALVRVQRTGADDAAKHTARELQKLNLLRKGQELPRRCIPLSSQ